MTYARSVRFTIAKDKKDAFTKLFSSEVMPLLRKQDGFRDEILLVNDHNVLGISLWKSGEAMTKYQSTTFPKIEQTLASVSASKPTVETFMLESTPSSLGALATA